MLGHLPQTITCWLRYLWMSCFFFSLYYINNLFGNENKPSDRCPLTCWCAGPSCLMLMFYANEKEKENCQSQGSCFILQIKKLRRSWFREKLIRVYSFTSRLDCLLNEWSSRYIFAPCNQRRCTDSTYTQPFYFISAAVAGGRGIHHHHHHTFPIQQRPSCCSALFEPQYGTVRGKEREGVPTGHYYHYLYIFFFVFLSILLLWLSTCIIIQSPLLPFHLFLYNTWTHRNVKKGMCPLFFQQGTHE